MPFTVRVNDAAPAVAVFGFMLLIVAGEPITSCQIWSVLETRLGGDSMNQSAPSGPFVIDPGL